MLSYYHELQVRLYGKYNLPTNGLQLLGFHNNLTAYCLKHTDPPNLNVSITINQCRCSRSSTRHASSTPIKSIWHYLSVWMSCQVHCLVPIKPRIKTHQNWQFLLSLISALDILVVLFSIGNISECSRTVTTAELLRQQQLVMGDVNAAFSAFELVSIKRVDK